MEKKLKNNAGMTLLELMLAAGIAATALSMVFASLLSIMLVGQVNEQRTYATTSLSSVLEEVQAMPFDEVLEYVAPELCMPGVYYSVELACVVPGEEEGGEAESEPSGGLVTLPLPYGYEEDDLPNPVELQVKINWSDAKGRGYYAKASTMRSR